MVIDRPTAEEEKKLLENIKGGNCSCCCPNPNTRGSSLGKTDVPGPLLFIPNINGTINSVFPMHPFLQGTPHCITISSSSSHPWCCPLQDASENQDAYFNMAKVTKSQLTHFPRGTGANGKGKHLISWEWECLGMEHLKKAPPIFGMESFPNLTLLYSLIHTPA